MFPPGFRPMAVLFLRRCLKAVAIASSHSHRRRLLGPRLRGDDNGVVAFCPQAFFFIMKAWKAAMVSGAVRRLAKILISSSTLSDKTEVSPRSSLRDRAMA